MESFCLCLPFSHLAMDCPRKKKPHKAEAWTPFIQQNGCCIFREMAVRCAGSVFLAFSLTVAEQEVTCLDVQSARKQESVTLCNFIQYCSSLSLLPSSSSSLDFSFTPFCSPVFSYLVWMTDN
jgi:hypothetical protein